MSKRYTSDKLIQDLNAYINRYCGGKVTQAAKAFDITPDAMRKMRRGDLKISNKVANVLGYEKDKRVYYIRIDK